MWLRCDVEPVKETGLDEDYRLEEVRDPERHQGDRAADGPHDSRSQGQAASCRDASWMAAARPASKTGRDLTARMGEVCGSSGSATDTTLFQC
jgi:hypothetical protein